jgi:hypothetical protein
MKTKVWKIFIVVFIVSPIITLFTIKESYSSNQNQDFIFFRIMDLKFSVSDPSYDFSFNLEVWNYKTYTITYDFELNCFESGSLYIIEHTVPFESRTGGSISKSCDNNHLNNPIVNFSPGLTKYNIKGFFVFSNINFVPHGIYEFYYSFSVKNSVEIYSSNAYYLYGSKTEDKALYDPISDNWGNITNITPKVPTLKLDPYELKSLINPTPENFASDDSKVIFNNQLSTKSNQDLLVLEFSAIILLLASISIIFLISIDIYRKSNQNEKKKKFSEYCSKCFIEIDTNDIFCSNCGLKI